MLVIPIYKRKHSGKPAVAKKRIPASPNRQFMLPFAIALYIIFYV